MINTLLPTALGRPFYARPAAVVARELLGHRLVRVLDNESVLVGRIVETEAYLGEGDASAHSARRPTDRTRHLWGSPGFAYVYLCMGMYHCLNVVTEPEGRAGCVLFRALEPLEGLDEMRLRRPTAKKDSDLCSGPGRLCRALDIDVRLNATDMTQGSLFIARGRLGQSLIGVSKRIGISKATDLPLRFFLQGSPYVSRAKTGSESRP